MLLTEKQMPLHFQSQEPKAGKRHTENLLEMEHDHVNSLRELPAFPVALCLLCGPETLSKPRSLTLSLKAGVLGDHLTMI